MAGYTRQSVASIINGANITAPPLNAEFNQILAAFNASTGHQHDGSTGNAPKIDLTTSISGYLPVVHGGVGGKNNTTATTDPTTSDDNTQGYAPGSIWINASTGYIHLCLYNTTGNANWVTVAAISNTNIIAPKVTNTVDIGTSTLQFKDIYIDGTGYIDNVNSETMSSTGNVDVGNNLTVTGNTTIGGTLGVTSNATVSGTSTLSGNVTAGADLSVTGNTTLTGTLSANGNVTLGNAASDTVTFTADVASDLIPSADGTHSLGAVGSEWQDLFIDGTANIDSLVADTADINAGSIDGTVLGAGSPASASFTGLTVSSTVNFSGATVSNLGSVTTADINGGTIDGIQLGTNSAVTEAQIDNININGNAITSTNSNGNIDLTPAGTGEVNISKVDIDSGAIDGTTIGSSSATSGAFTTVSTSGQATLATVDINGGTIDGTAIGSTTTSSGAFTTVSASGGFTGAISGNVTGNVTGNLTGNVTGNVTGDVTGDLTGNVTASTGTSTFENVVVNGTANFTNTALTNVVDPTNAQDAATKNYVDTELADLVNSAPGTLDTLNELAAALGDDPNFSTTITNSIATKLPLAGGTMSGAIAMGTSKITGMGDPTSAQDAATKTYVDTQRDTRLATTGGTMTGDISIGSNKITTTADPTNANDLARKSYVDAIHGSAVAAATSATNAANSATASANSATASANSASASASSAASAAASYDLFDDRFLGAKSSAPTVDNDGDALVVGSLYFDTTAQIMKVYGSSGWQSAGSAVNGTSERFKYTATSNQTTFSGNDDNGNALGYDAGFLDVFLSGIRLVNGVDFTATSGTSIQLVAGAATGDILEIVTFGTFTLANQSLSDMQDVNTGGVSTNDILAYNGSNFVPTSSPTFTTVASGGTITVNSGHLNLASDGAHVYIGADIDMRITHDGSNGLLRNDTGDFTIDSAGDIVLDAAGNDILLKDAGVSFGQLTNDSGNLIIYNAGSQMLKGLSGGSNAQFMGNVGIGTSNIDEMLHVEKSAGTTLVKTEVAANSIVGFEIQKTNATTANWRIVDGQVANGQLEIWDNTNSRSILNADSSEIVINDTGANLDFRVESDSNTHMLFVDAGTNQVGINRSSFLNTTVRLEVGGADNVPLIAAEASGVRAGLGVANSNVGLYHDTTSVLTIDSSGKIVTVTNGAIESASSAGTLTISGGATNKGGQILLRGGNIDSDIIFKSQASTATPQEVVRIGPAEMVVNEGSLNYDFRVETDANTHGLFVDASANGVMIGNTSLSLASGFADQHGVGINAGTGQTQISGDGTALVVGRTSTGGAGTVVDFRLASVQRGTIDISTDGVTYSTGSDIRLKTDIQSIDSATNKLMAMNPVSHKWKANPEANAVYGFIAQEMMEIVPEAVVGDPDGEEMMSMDYGRITPVIVAALQEANNKIMELEQRIKDLEAKL